MPALRRGPLHCTARNGYLWENISRRPVEAIMFTTIARPFAVLLDATMALPAASRVSADIEAHRVPRAADLKRLGIDPVAFARVRQD